jgi:4-amino-4-deoxychorismate lyase
MSGALATWIDGAAAWHIPADDRGLQYGDGLFETLSLRNGRARFLELHLARLARGCACLRIPFDAMPELRADIDAASACAPARALLKIIVTRGSPRRRGYAADHDASPRRIVSLFAEDSPPMPAQGVELAVASLRIADNPALAGIKHLNRLENVLASTEARAAGAFDALLLGGDGRVVSGAMTNLFVVSSGAVATPPVDRAGVAGVMRTAVLRECVALGLTATERTLTMTDLHGADEAFVSNARIGVVPVRRVGQHGFTMNSVGLRIAAHLESLDA